MDPNAKLAELLGLAWAAIDRADRGDFDRAGMTEPEAEALRMAELVNALDGWMVRGGFKPARWDQVPALKQPDLSKPVPAAKPGKAKRIPKGIGGKTRILGVPLLPPKKKRRAP